MSRWSKSVAVGLPEQQDDREGNASVAACMVWQYGQPSKLAQDQTQALYRPNIAYDDLYRVGKNSSSFDRHTKKAIAKRAAVMGGKPPVYPATVASATLDERISRTQLKLSGGSGSKQQASRQVTDNKTIRENVKVKLENELAAGVHRPTIVQRRPPTPGNYKVASPVNGNTTIRFVDKVAADCVDRCYDEMLIRREEEEEDKERRRLQTRSASAALFADDDDYVRPYGAQRKAVSFQRSRSAYGLDTFRSMDSCTAQYGDDDLPVNTYRSVAVEEPQRTVFYNNGQPRIVVRSSQDDDAVVTRRGYGRHGDLWTARSRSQQRAVVADRGKLLSSEDNNKGMTLSVQCPADATDLHLNVRLTSRPSPPDHAPRHAHHRHWPNKAPSRDSDDYYYRQAREFDWRATDNNHKYTNKPIPVTWPLTVSVPGAGTPAWNTYIPNSALNNLKII